MDWQALVPRTYLWHYPLLLLMNPVANINDTPWWQYILQVLLVVAVAECSYRFIETPFRRAPLGAPYPVRDGTTTPADWARAHVPSAQPALSCWSLHWAA